MRVNEITKRKRDKTIENITDRPSTWTNTIQYLYSNDANPVMPIPEEEQARADFNDSELKIINDINGFSKKVNKSIEIPKICKNKIIAHEEFKKIFDKSPIEATLRTSQNTYQMYLYFMSRNPVFLLTFLINCSYLNVNFISDIFYILKNQLGAKISNATLRNKKMLLKSLEMLIGGSISHLFKDSIEKKLKLFGLEDTIDYQSLTDQLITYLSESFIDRHGFVVFNALLELELLEIKTYYKQGRINVDPILLELFNTKNNEYLYSRSINVLYIEHNNLLVLIGGNLDLSRQSLTNTINTPIKNLNSVLSKSNSKNKNKGNDIDIDGISYNKDLINQMIECSLDDILVNVLIEKQISS